MLRRLLSMLVALAAAGGAAAQSFNVRVEALGAAADRYLAQASDDPKRYPAELRRVAWMNFEGDNRPDALLILKQNRDDCAAASRGKQPCKALLVLGAADDGFSVATEFPLHEHALVFRKVASGHVESMYYTSETGADPTYRRFVPRGGHFEPDGSTARLAQLMELRSFVTDDRSLPLLADQSYAASQFENRRARLAPFRLHIDGINNRSTKAVVDDPNFADRAKFLADNLMPDATRLAEAIGWHQTLDLRIWSCDDWMVPRRFWEIEEVRLGRVGICADPVVFALRRGIVQSTAEFVAMARFRLLQEAGVAFVLRVAPISWELRESLKSPAQREALVFYGTAAGIMLGATLKLQTPESATQMHALWKRVSDQWFSAYEKERRQYVVKSPELRAFDHDLGESERAMNCTLRALGTNLPAARGAACNAQAMDSITFLRTSLREAMSP